MSLQTASGVRLDPPGGPRRWRSFLVGFATAAVLFAFAVTVLAWFRYEPLAGTGSGSSFPGEGLSDIGIQNASQAEYTNGAEYTYAFTLRNTGRVGVRITSLQGHSSVLLYIEQVRLTEEEDFFSRRTQSFEPFVLGPGEQRGVFVHSRFGGCERMGGEMGSVLSWVTFGYRTLGLPRTQTVTLPTAVDIRSPGEGIGYREGCRVLRTDALRGGHELDVDLKVSMDPRPQIVIDRRWSTPRRATLPGPDRENRPWRDCRISVNERFEASVSSVEAGRAHFVSARRMVTPEGRRWDPEEHRAQNLQLTCAEGTRTARVQAPALSGDQF